MTLESMVIMKMPRKTNMRFWMNNNAIDLNDVDNEILFVMTPWSATCHASLKLLADVLAAADPASTIKVTVINTDDCEKLFMHPDFDGRLGGYGETAWYRSGKQIGFTKYGSARTVYLESTLQLLRQTEQSDPPKRDFHGF